MAKLFVVGIGPGNRDNITYGAYRALEKSQIIVGYQKYVELIKPWFLEKEFYATGMREEKERCQFAVTQAAEGKIVSIISSGDPEVYGMAGLVFQTADKMGSDIEIEVVPGITAAMAAGSLLGAPLTHDFAVISLSDLLTPWPLIQKRIQAAAEADFIICIYNHKSKNRQTNLSETIETILHYRNPETPVGIVRHAGRSCENVALTKLKDLNFCTVDMFSTIIIGNSSTYIHNNKMITPRGYIV